MSVEDSINDIEIVNMPTGFSNPKVVQLYLKSENGERPILVMTYPDVQNRHTAILEKFLSNYELDFPRVKIGNSQVPALLGSNYRVVGMGYATIVPSQKEFYLPGNRSTDYQIGSDSTHNEILKNYLESQGWNVKQ